MKKLILVLAAALALSLLCSCAKPLPEEPVQADPEPEAPAEVHVTTFTADILSSGGGTLTVRPADKDSSFGSTDTVTVALADGLVPTGADGWPISVSELTQALQVDITYLGGVETSDPPQVLAVAIRVVPSEEPVEDTTNTVTDPQRSSQSRLSLRRSRLPRSSFLRRIRFRLRSPMTASRFTASRASAPRSSAAARQIWMAAARPRRCSCCASGTNMTSSRLCCAFRRGRTCSTLALRSRMCPIPPASTHTSGWLIWTRTAIRRSISTAI